MKRSVLCFALTALFFASTVFPALSAAPKKPVVALIDLQPLTFETLGHDGEILFALLHALEQDESIALIPRREMERRLFAAGLANCETAEEFIRAGEKLGADYVLSGRALHGADGTKVQIVQMDVRKRRILHTWSASFRDGESPDRTAADLSRQIAAAANGQKVAAAPPPPLVAPRTSSATSPDKGRDTRTATPPAPRILEAAGVIGGARITFSAPQEGVKKDSSIASFRLYRKEAGAAEWLRVAEAEARIFADPPEQSIVDRKDVRDGTTYAYALTYVDENGLESALSAPVNATPPAPVLSVMRDSQLRRIELSFPPLEGTEAYTLQRQATDGTWQDIARLPAYQGRFADESGLEDGRSYIYRLIAHDGQGHACTSAEVTAQTKEPPPPPSQFQAEVWPSGSIVLKWAPLEQEDVGGYLIFREEDGGEAIEIGAARGRNASSFTDTLPRKSGRTHRYTIRTYNLYRGKGASSPAITIPPQSGLSDFPSVPDPSRGGTTI